jgi:hypothetical protein
MWDVDAVGARTHQARGHIRWVHRGLEEVIERIERIVTCAAV